MFKGRVEKINTNVLLENGKVVAEIIIRLPAKYAHALNILDEIIFVPQWNAVIIKEGEK